MPSARVPRPLPPLPVEPTPQTAQQAIAQQIIDAALGLLFEEARRHWPNTEVRAALEAHDADRLLIEADRWAQDMPEGRDRDELRWAISTLRDPR